MPTVRERKKNEGGKERQNSVSPSEHLSPHGSRAEDNVLQDFKDTIFLGETVFSGFFPSSLANDAMLFDEDERALGRRNCKKNRGPAEEREEKRLPGFLAPFQRL